MALRAEPDLDLVPLALLLNRSRFMKLVALLPGRAPCILLVAALLAFDVAPARAVALRASDAVILAG